MIPKVSQTKFHQILITKSKVIHVQIPASKRQKTKKREKIFGLQNGAIRRLQIGAAFMDYKSRQEGLQIGCRVIDFRSGQKEYKSGLGFQIGEKRFQGRAEITNRSNRDFKSGQGLQIGAEHI